MATSIEERANDDLNALIALKSNIEDGIESQATILRANNSTLDSPLTDGDGFPRADIDVWAVRHARVRIIRFRNDLSSLMDKIATALERVHASQLARPETDAKTPPHSLLPFAKVDAVAPNSPAQLAVSCYLAQSPDTFNATKGTASWGSRH
jgi:26S proteasome non-ATPase regulatory subunit 9